MLRSVYLGLSAVILAVGCKKEDAIDAVRVRYAETACADPWKTGQGDADAEVQRRVQVFFDSVGIAPLEVLVSGGGEEDECRACFCRTGRIITATIEAHQRDDYAAYGFE